MASHAPYSTFIHKRETGHASSLRIYYQTEMAKSGNVNHPENDTSFIGLSVNKGIEHPEAVNTDSVNRFLKKNKKKPSKEDVDAKHADGNLTLYLEEDCYHIINCGSVGQPRDNDSRACYVTYDSVARRLKYHRLKYNIEKVQNQISDAGLPRTLAQRLERRI